MGGFLSAEERPRYALKFLLPGQRSKKGWLIWEKGKWVQVSGRLRACRNGLHLVRTGIREWGRWAPEIWIAEIDTRHPILSDGNPMMNKLVVRRARILKRIRPTKADLADFIESHGGFRTGVWYAQSRRKFMREFRMNNAYQYNGWINNLVVWMQYTYEITNLADWLIRRYAPELFTDES